MLSKEILNERKKGIGGSDAASILGLSHFRTPYELYLEKTEDIKEENKDKKNDWIFWGNALEDVIARNFSELNEAELIKSPMRWHQTHPFMFANIDRFIPAWNAVLEIKTADKFMSRYWGEHGSDQIPEQYLIQCAHYASVYNVDSVYLAVLIGGNDYREYVYKRNLTLENALIEKERYFWEEHVLKMIPPDSMNPTEAAFKYSGVTEGASITANNTIKTALNALKEIKQKTKLLSDKENGLKAFLMESMKEAEILMDDVGITLATWKKTKNGRQFRLSAGE